MICICVIAISCSHQQKTANRTAVIVKKTIVKCLNFHSKHRSVTDLAKPDPGGGGGTAIYGPHRYVPL